MEALAGSSCKLSASGRLEACSVRDGTEALQEPPQRTSGRWSVGSPGRICTGATALRAAHVPAWSARMTRCQRLLTGRYACPTELTRGEALTRYGSQASLRGCRCMPVL